MPKPFMSRSAARAAFFPESQRLRTASAFALWTAGFALLTLVPAMPARAQISECPTGARVVDGAGRRGTVVGQQGIPRLRTCAVDMDNGPKGQPYASRLLRLADPAAATMTRVKPGHYECGGRNSPTPLRITFGAGSMYSFEDSVPGNYFYEASTQTLTFLSGQYAGWSGKYIGDGRFRLFQRSTTPSNTVCAWKY